MSQITEKTWVPISVIGALALPAIGLCAWLTTMYNQGIATASELEIVKKSQQSCYLELRDKISEIQVTLGELRFELKRIQHGK